MISFDEAKRVALAKIGPKCALVETATIEKPYGWYFFGQSRAYVETGDKSAMLIGVGGFIVERADGRVFQFGSAFPPQEWIENYERGFKYDRYDLRILAVIDMPTTLELLGRLNMHYVVPEKDDDTVWVIPRPYTPEQLRAMLVRLPCTFANQAFWHRVRVFDDIDTSGCCKYEISEHVPAADSPAT